MKLEDFDEAKLAEAASTFAALGSEQRLLVLRILLRAGPQGLSIGALGERTGITGATLTHHMKTLAATPLVTQEKRGRSVICIAANYDKLEGLTQSLLSECCLDCTGDDCDHVDDHTHGASGSDFNKDIRDE